jgi:hypothetical protein
VAGGGGDSEATVRRGLLRLRKLSFFSLSCSPSQERISVRRVDYYVSPVQPHYYAICEEDPLLRTRLHGTTLSDTDVFPAELT